MRHGVFVSDGTITVPEYIRLRNAVGWWRVDEGSVARSLGSSLYSVTARQSDSELIGFGRVIGDPLYMYVQDMIVLPEFQEEGIGRALMEHILGFVSDCAQPGSYLGLMCARGAEAFYTKFGFTRRPPDGPGMQYVFEK